MKSAIAAALTLVALASPCYAGVSVNVSGQCNPWLSGMPIGSGASFVDVSPDQAPTYVPLVITGGMVLTFSASGGVSNTGSPPLFGPDGGPEPFPHTVGAENGISDILVNLNALVGVFLTDDMPTLAPAPAGIDFTNTGIGMDFLSLEPLLQQVFFIGDGATGTRSEQTFVAPAGATRLFLGAMDAHNNLNNIGSFDVTVNVIPAPGTALLALAGLASLRRRR